MPKQCGSAQYCKVSPHQLLVLACLAFVLTAIPTAAGSIGVDVDLLLEPTGRRPAREVPVILHHPTGDPRTPLQEILSLPGTRRGITDWAGRVSFLGVEPGRYTVSLLELGENIVPPAENPLHPAPVVTLFDDEETLWMQVELQSGARVGVELEIPGPAEGFRAFFRHRASGLELAIPFLPQLPRLETLLAPTAWEVAVEAPPGYLLTGLAQDLAPLDGHVATLALRPRVETTWLMWRFDLQATLSGEVDVEGGPVQAVTIAATLLQAGDWLPATEARGGSLYTEVLAPVTPAGRYRFDLPAGVWRLEPRAEQLVTSDPPAQVVEVGIGEVERADFEIVLAETLWPPIRVQVLDAAQQPLADAVVHLTPRDDPHTVLRAGTTGPTGEVELPRLPPGLEILLLAGHPDYREAQRVLTEFRSQDIQELTISLEPDAAFQLRAVDLDRQPARGVAWTIERLEPPLELALTDPEFVAAKHGRVAVTDDSGRARAEGFYGGRYRIRAEIPSRYQPGSAFRVGQRRGRLARQVTVWLPERGVIDLVAQQQPGATLELALVCDDNGPLPATAAALVTDLDAPIHHAGEAGDLAILRAEEIPLTGRRRDRLLVGPLAQGVYRLAVRPTGFSRWTWAFEARDPAASYPIQIDVDEKTPSEIYQLGDFKLACAPVLDLEPRVLVGPLPALHDIAVRAQLLEGNGKRESDTPLITTGSQRFEIRGLPPGPARLEVVLTHPHFLPTPALPFEIDLDLARGRMMEVEAQIEAVGGAIHIHGDAAVAQLVDQQGTLRTAALVEGEVLFPSLAPGYYAVALCSAPDCAAPRHQWPAIEVRRGVTVNLVDPPSRGAGDGGLFSKRLLWATPGSLRPGGEAETRRGLDTQ